MDKAHLKKDTIAMAVLVLLSILAYVFVIPNQIPETATFSDAGGVGSRTVPYMVVVVIGILSLGQVIKNLVLMKGMEEKKVLLTDDEKKEARVKLIKTLILYGLYVLFGLLFTYVGFAAAAIIVLPAILYLLGIREKGYYIGILSFAGITFVLFRYVLEVIVPLWSIGG